MKPWFKQNIIHNLMNNTCNCDNRERYEEVPAKDFFNCQEWIVSHYPEQKVKILVCPVCSTKWLLKYILDGVGYTIEKKYKHPESLRGRSICMWVGECGLNVNLSGTKFIKVLDDDERAIVESRTFLDFKGQKIKYFFIKTRYSGYLSDLLSLRKTIGVDVGYLKTANDIVLSEFKEQDFTFEWVGSVSIEA